MLITLFPTILKEAEERTRAPVLKVIPVAEREEPDPKEKLPLPWVRAFKDKVEVV